MKNKLNIFLIASFLILAGIILTVGIFFVINFNQNKVIQENIKSFDDCSKYYPVQETYPERCSTPDGRLFIKQIPEEKIELEGTITCLTPYNLSGVQDLSCAIGLEAKDGKSYALYDPENKFLISNTASKVKISGILNTNIDPTNKYDIYGKIEIKSLVKLD